MLNFFRSFGSIDLKTALNQTKKIKVRGVLFEIRKVDVTNYLDGSKSMISTYDTYIASESEADKLNLQKKIRDHYRDVFMSSVVKPKLYRKEKDPEDGVFVDDLFKDWDIANGLYEEIMFYTYGKKNSILSAYPKSDLSSST